jgi:hypothetical protein
MRADFRFGELAHRALEQLLFVVQAEVHVRYDGRKVTQRG